MILFWFIFINLVSCIFSSGCPAYDDVNVFIGSGGIGFGYGSVSPAAQIPYGAVRVGPDTTSSVVDLSYRHCSGYNYHDTAVRAISHTRLVGAGVSDLGNFGVMPIRKHHRHDASDNNVRDGIKEFIGNFTSRGWWSAFDKSSEVGSPGQYSVFLTSPQVQVDLVALGTHSAMHRYKWPVWSLEEDSEAKFDHRSRHSAGMVFDICHSSKTQKPNDSPCKNASLSIQPDEQVLTAEIYFADSLSGGGVWMYFYATWDFEDNAVLDQWTVCTTDLCEDPLVNQTSISSDSGVLYAIASVTATHELASLMQMRVGLSFISVELAQKNVESDLSLRRTAASTSVLDFEMHREVTIAKWCSQLNMLEVGNLDNDDDIKVLLHSANYRSSMSPTMYSEVGGLYMGMDREVHNSTEEALQETDHIKALSPGDYGAGEYSDRHFSDLSLWDTFRTQHPWLLLTHPDVAVGVLRSAAAMTAQTGVFPKWPLASVESGCMIGQHGGALVLEGLLSGLEHTFDVPLCQEALLRMATVPGTPNGRKDIENYTSLGYVPQESDDNSASLTLTYAYDDFVLAELCDYVGDVDNAQAALKRSKNYGQSWSEDRHFMCPRSITGEFLCPVSPTGPQAWGDYKEGDALHWSWFVMHDPAGLMDLFPSPKVYDAALESFFALHVEDRGPFGAALPNPYYWAGNEVDMFAAWMFNFGPNCTRTQYWTRRLTHMHFSTEPSGVPGNEDYGAQAAWLLFASIGLFPQAGTSQFLIGSPRVQSLHIDLDSHSARKTDSFIDITTVNNSEENVFVEKLLVNGEEHSSPFIDRSILVAEGGVTLEFTMTSIPLSGLCNAAALDA